jgi:sugar lactone lactonase YvrE
MGALSPDERTMYVANTRSSQYIHGINLDAAGNMVGTVMANSDVDGGTPSDLSAGGRRLSE